MLLNKGMRNISAKNLKGSASGSLIQCQESFIIVFSTLKLININIKISTLSALFRSTGVPIQLKFLSNNTYNCESEIW